MEGSILVCFRFAMTSEIMICGQMTKKSIFLFKTHNSVFVNFRTVLSTSSKTERVVDGLWFGAALLSQE